MDNLTKNLSILARIAFKVTKQIKNSNIPQHCASKAINEVKEVEDTTILIPFSWGHGTQSLENELQKGVSLCYVHVRASSFSGTHLC